MCHFEKDIYEKNLKKIKDKLEDYSNLYQEYQNSIDIQTKSCIKHEKNYVKNKIMEKCHKYDLLEDMINNLKVKKMKFLI